MGYRKTIFSLYATALLTVLSNLTLPGKYAGSLPNKTYSTLTEPEPTNNNTDATSQEVFSVNENTSFRADKNTLLPVTGNLEIDSSSPHTNIHLCRSPKIDLKNGVEKNITFQCNGTRYDKFADSLLLMNEASNISTWGKRPFPIPDNRHVLFFGNSHTRQLLEAFVCQYEDVISFGALWAESHNAGFIRFANNATVHWLVNNWVAFSNNWTRDFVDELPHPYPLDSYDAIVLGQFNSIQGNSNYVMDMRNKSKIHPNMDVHRRPPTLGGLARQVPSHVHLVGAPMLNLRGEGRYRQNLRDMETLPNRSVSAINTRRYVPKLGECGARKQFIVNDDCLNTRPARVQLHKCAGSRGGFADPVSWDLIEVLNDLQK